MYGICTEYVLAVVLFLFSGCGSPPVSIFLSSELDLAHGLWLIWMFNIPRSIDAFLVFFLGLG